MSIFGSRNESIKRVEQIIEVSRGSGSEAEKRFGQKLKDDLRNPEKQIISPTELYCKCVALLYDNSSVPVASCLKILEYGQQVYLTLFPQGQETTDFENVSEVFLEMFTAGGAIAQRCFDVVLFKLFTNCRNYSKWYRGVGGNAKYPVLVGYYKNYGTLARSYFPNEESFTANFIFVCNRIKDAADPQEEYDAQVRKVEHMAGIYEVDEATIMEVEQQIASAKETIDRSRDILSVMDSRIKTVDSLTENALERVKQMCASEIALAEATLNDIDSKLHKAYDKFQDSQRKRVLMEKQKLVEELVSESEEALEAFRNKVKNVLGMARLEFAKMNNESGQVFSKLEQYVKDEEKLKAMLGAQDEQAEIMKKLERVLVLNESNLDLLESRVAREGEAMAARMQVQAVTRTNDSTQSDNLCEIRVQNTDSDEIPPINPLLDENVDFNERFSVAMEAKKAMENRGEHFHCMFDDVLIAVMENVNPYLIGPSGCGKTYMVNQIARILNVGFIDIGYINEEYDILGFQTANGGYSRPNFYRCYKYGQIAFCDELDNGNSRATVKLNSFLSNTKDAGYSFPNGEHVKRHGNFRIIAAGNTSGNGADSVYCTREKIEESVQQRFTPIYVGYDNEVERAILGKYTDWYEFIVLFREATNAWSAKSHSAAPGIITTRDSARIKKYLDNGSFGMEKILDYEFIQTKDESYLAFLAESIKKVKADNPAKQIADCFVQKVDAIRINDPRR